MSRQRKIPTPAWQSGGGGSHGITRVQLYGAIGVILLALAAVSIIGIGYLSQYIDDHNRPGSLAMRVGDVEYSVSEYTERAKLNTQSGASSNYQIILATTSSDLIRDALLLQFQDELGISASGDEIAEELATLLGISVDDPNFDQRLQEEVATTELTEDQYRDIATAEVLNTKALEHFEAELPETAESIHYRQINVADQATADDLKLQIEEGADFAEIATNNSTDTTTAAEGGDAGWVPSGYLGDALENVLFSLDTDTLITYPTGSGVIIYEVLEKDDARPIDEDKTGRLGAQAYNDWLDEKKDAVEFVNNMDLSDGDVDKITYVIDHAALTAQ